MSELSGVKHASHDKAAAFWVALQKLEVLNLDMEWIHDEGPDFHDESDDDIISVNTSFFQSVSAMSQLR